MPAPHRIAIAAIVVLGLVLVALTAGQAGLAWPIGAAAVLTVLVLLLLAERRERGLLRALGRLRAALDLPAGPRPASAAGMSEIAERIEDLARQRARAAALRERLLAALPDPAVLIGPDRRIEDANAVAGDVFDGVARGQDVAETIRDPDILEAIDAVLAGRPAVDVDITMEVPHRREFVGQVAKLEADTAISPALLVLHEITALRLSERMRADFVANASHEIRTPLSVLAGCVETILGAARNDPKAQQSFLVTMQAQVARMTGLVDDLLSLSRIEMIERTAPTELIEIEPLLRRAGDAIESSAAQSRAVLELDIEADLPAVRGDASQLEQVVFNLLDNAVKYGGGRIELDARLGADAVPRRLEITVRDNGPGIAEKHLPRLTERFYRIDAPRSRSLGGTGLGLAIVKHIVSRHRGELTVSSRIGAGSEFTVHLPVPGSN